ncbi:putative Kunitz-type serine protease inhibitor [Haemaphysalis longicornis]
MGSLQVAAVLFIVYAVQGQHPVARNASCNVEPTLEGCTIIRLKWSFKADSGACEQNYVCNDHANSFETRQDCSNVCPPTTGPRPGLQRRDCKYWLVHGASCGRQLTNSYWGGKTWCYVVLYTGCGTSKNNYYAYNSCFKQCIEIVPRGRQA